VQKAKEMDLLAKVTGQSRAAKEKEREELMADGQFRAAMAGLGPEVEASASTLIQAMPTKEMQNFAKDMIANGTATNESSRALLAQFPQLGKQFTDLHRQTQSNVAISKQQMNQTMNIGRVEGPASLKRIKTAAAANESLHGVAASAAAFGRVQEDAIKIGEDQQDSTTKNTDKMAEALNKSKEKLAEFSNGFQMALANSGLLDLLMSAFSTLANFVMTWVVPAFNIIAAVLQKVWTGFTILLAPVIDLISSKLGGGGLAGTIETIDGIMNAVFPVLSSIVRGAITAFEGIWTAVMSLFDPFQRLFDAFGVGSDATTVLTDYFLFLGETIGGVAEFLGAYFGMLIDAVTFVVHWFKEVVNKSEFLTKVFSAVGDAVKVSISTIRAYLSAEGFRSLMELLTDKFMGLVDTILDLIPEWAGGISDEEKKKRDEERALRATARDARLEAVLAEKDQKLKAAKEGVKQDSAKFQQQKLHLGKMGGLQKEEEDAKKKAAESKIPKDYTDTTKLLGAELQAQQSDILPPKTKEEAKAAVANIKPVGKASEDLLAAGASLDVIAKEKAAKAKADAEVKAKAEADAKTKADADAKTKADAESKTKEEKNKKPESAETLLAELNTKMAQLLKHAATTTSNTYATYEAAKSLNGNLYKA
jgi:hypothetical protein